MANEYCGLAEEHDAINRKAQQLNLVENYSEKENSLYQYMQLKRPSVGIMFTILIVVCETYLLSSAPRWETNIFSVHHFIAFIDLFFDVHGSMTDDHMSFSQIFLRI